MNSPSNLSSLFLPEMPIIAVVDPPLYKCSIC